MCKQSQTSTKSNANALTDTTGAQASNTTGSNVGTQSSSSTNTSSGATSNNSNSTSAGNTSGLTSSSNILPAYVTQAGQDLLSQSQGLQPYTGYTGEITAPVNQTQTQALSLLNAFVNSQPGGANAPVAGGGAPTPTSLTTAAATQPAPTVSTGTVVDQSGPLGSIASYMNPYTQQALAPTLQQLQINADTQNKQLAAGATEAGAFGDASYGELQGLNNFYQNQAVGNAVGTAENNAFNDAMGLREQDVSRFNSDALANAGFQQTGQGLQLQGANQLENIGTTDQQNLLSRLNAMLQGGGVQQTTQQATDTGLLNDFLRQYASQIPALQAQSGILSALPYDTSQVGTSAGTSANTGASSSQGTSSNVGTGTYSGSTDNTTAGTSAGNSSGTSAGVNSGNSTTTQPDNSLLSLGGALLGAFL